MKSLSEFPARFWARMTFFFERGDLVPLAVIVSAWHYWKALSPAGESPFVVVPIAILIDMMHFRTVRMAADRPTLPRLVIASCMTMFALFFHYVFYSLGLSESTLTLSGILGSIPVPLLALLYALPIPFGIGVLAWYNAEGVKEQIDERFSQLQDKLAEMAAGREADRNAMITLTRKWDEAQSVIANLKESLKDMTAMWEAASRERDEATGNWQDAEAESKKLGVQIDGLQDRLQIAQENEIRLTLLESMLDTIDPVIVDLMTSWAGITDDTQADIARRHDKSESTVSRLARQLTRSVDEQASTVHKNGNGKVS